MQFPLHTLTCHNSTHATSFSIKQILSVALKWFQYHYLENKLRQFTLSARLKGNFLKQAVHISRQENSCMSRNFLEGVKPVSKLGVSTYRLCYKIRYAEQQRNNGQYLPRLYRLHMELSFCDTCHAQGHNNKTTQYMVKVRKNYNTVTQSNDPFLGTIPATLIWSNTN